VLVLALLLNPAPLLLVVFSSQPVMSNTEVTATLTSFLVNVSDLQYFMIIFTFAFLNETVVKLVSIALFI
jgi:hypothetical protein